MTVPPSRLDNPDRTARIFVQALEVAPEGRAAFLDEACGGDPALRAEIESLLRYHRPGTIRGIIPADGSVAPSQKSSSETLSLLVTSVTKLLSGRGRKLMAWVMAALFLGGVGYWTRNRVESSLRGQIGEQLRVVLAADVAALQMWIDMRKGEAAAWAANPLVQDLTERLVHLAGEDAVTAEKLKGAAIQKEFGVLLRPFLAQTPSSENRVALLLDRTGLRVAATAPYLGLIGRHNNERSAAAMVPILNGQIQFMRPSHFDDWAWDAGPDRRIVTFVAAPVRDSGGRIIAVLVLARVTDPDYSRILTIARMGNSGETYAVSADGLMLSSSRFDKVLKETGLLPDPSNSSSMLNAQVRDPGGDVTRGYLPAADLETRPLTTIARIAVASRGKPAEQRTGIILDPYRDYRGVDVVGAWRWLPEQDFAVLTEVDAKEAFAVLGYVSRGYEILFALLSMFVVLTLAASVALARTRARETRMGAYTLLQPIGEGGMAKVYLARHALLRRPTAIKVLKALDQDSKESKVRFEREVQAASRLTHPNTIQIHDFGSTPEGTFYYAMEYLPGVTLAELVALDGPLTPGRVIHLLRQICRSLKEAHAQGLVHRDIKPLNIMVCERGGNYDFVKVLDFGLVRQLDVTATMDVSSAHQLIGTPLYMAPERFRDALAADPGSDVYSIGAVAYYLTTGRSVFHALTGLDLQSQVLFSEPKRPSSLVPHPIPESLERLILRCLSKAPANRPASAAELLQELEALRDVPEWTETMAQEWWARHLPTLVKALIAH